jgi:signal transduction histidine kinase
VIVSTQLSETGEVLLRVRDTGVGMSEADVATALEPFRQLSTTGRGTAGGSGLGLPLTKALAEANRAGFAVKSNVNAGTLVEISFPSNRVLAG